MITDPREEDPKPGLVFGTRIPVNSLGKMGK